MTAVSARTPLLAVRPGPVERMLLLTAARLEALAAARLQRRATRRAAAASDVGRDVRAAELHARMLPR